jgi:hypothetical protein
VARLFGTIVPGVPGSDLSRLALRVVSLALNWTMVACEHHAPTDTRESVDAVLLVTLPMVRLGAFGGRRGVSSTVRHEEQSLSRRNAQSNAPEP